MYVGLRQPHGDGERYVTPARAAAKETIYTQDTEEKMRMIVPLIVSSSKHLGIF